MRQFAALVTLLACAALAVAQTLSAGSFQATGPTAYYTEAPSNLFFYAYTPSPTAPQLQIYNASTISIDIYPVYLPCDPLCVNGIIIPPGVTQVVTFPVNTTSLIGSSTDRFTTIFVYLTPGIGL